LRLCPCIVPSNERQGKIKEDSIVKLVIGVACALFAVGVLASGARAEGDPARGKIDFKLCAACHSVEPGENGIGPSLHSIVGRKAASLPDFNYSSAMKRSTIVWDEATLGKFLTDPSATVPGTKMIFAGVKDPQQLDDLIAYLKAASH
jgi:cytochrome c